MSAKSEFRERLERLEQAPADNHDHLSSDATINVTFKRLGALEQPITVAGRMRVAGMTLRAAHDAITRLASMAWANGELPANADLHNLAQELRPLNVEVSRRRVVDEPAAFLSDVRARHHLSQSAFADRLGLDVRTLQNWEQGRNRPDAAVLSLVMLFDRDPALVMDVTHEPVATTPTP